MDAAGERTSAEADAGDVRMCGVFVVAVVTGTAWFYWSVLCQALRIVQ